MEAILDRIGESRFGSILTDYAELIGIRNVFDPEYSSSKLVKKFAGRDKRGNIRHEQVTSKKLFLAHLFENYTNDRFQEILCALCIPYEYNNIKQVQYTKLGSGTGGYLPNQKTIDYPYWNSVLSAEAKHFESTLFGISHPDCLVPGVNLPHIDPSSNWADQNQFGIGHKTSQEEKLWWDGKRVAWGGDPVLTLLMVEGMGFFRGRLATSTGYANQLKGVDFDEVVTAENYVKTIPFCVRNHSLSFTTGTMAEQQSNGAATEIWAPQWEEAMTYRTLLTEVRNLSEVAQRLRVSLSDSSDMMMFLSEKGRTNGVSVFHRYLMPDRRGQG